MDQSKELVIAFTASRIAFIGFPFGLCLENKLPSPLGLWVFFSGLASMVVLPLICACCIKTLPHLAKRGMYTMGTVFFAAAVFFLWRLRTGS